MKKLRLDSLAVESFATDATPSYSGTVVGHSDAFNQACKKIFPFTTNPGDTYNGTCAIDGCGGVSNVDCTWSCQGTCEGVSLPDCNGGTDYSNGQILNTMCCPEASAYYCP